MPPLHRLILEDTPVGPLTLVASPDGLREVRFGRPAGPAPGEVSVTGSGSHPLLDSATRALDAYFRGAGDGFAALPIDLGDPSTFRRAVWSALRTIPRGEVTTYGGLALEIGRGSARSIGQAVGANPLPIVIPCHRVVAADGRLGGFSGGLDRKITLLGLEGYRAEGSRFGAKIAEGPALQL